MLTDKARQLAAGILNPIARALARIGLTPNMLTVIGFLFNVFVAWVLSRGAGWWVWGGVLLILSSIFDAFDGAVARQSGQVSKFGGFLDSTLDRASEAVVYFGLLYAYLNTTPPATVEPLLIFIATVGSLLVSYTRARVEGLGATMKDGWFTRLERIVVLVVGLLLSSIFPQIMLIVLAVLAVGTVITAIQRILVARAKLTAE
ncbi:MAG: CDP-alcohol phosphatidyltransferase family protein [Anaerolineae bacterium]|nr:CDP-alcohol phosphatidyltransferase family protein [Anaerolineae bacterium]